ncbi:MAG TPA: DUF6527 family protein [Phormidium sp.]
MSKLEPVKEGYRIIGYRFYCPGCKSHHEPYLEPSQVRSSYWRLVDDGSLEKPTISPSILTKVSRPDGSKVMICHLYVTNGKISYLPDCTHELAGQVVDMEDIEDVE